MITHPTWTSIRLIHTNIGPIRMKIRSICTSIRPTYTHLSPTGTKIHFIHTNIRSTHTNISPCCSNSCPPAPFIRTYVPLIQVYNHPSQSYQNKSNSYQHSWYLYEYTSHSHKHTFHSQYIRSIHKTSVPFIRTVVLPVRIYVPLIPTYVSLTHSLQHPFA